MNTARTVDVNQSDAADWLIRSALPRFLDLMTLEDHAAYFSTLEPFKGHTRTGRLSGWRGAGKQLAEAEESVNRAFRNLLLIQNRFDADRTRTDAEEQARAACVFARAALLPSGLGYDACRVIGWISITVEYGSELLGEEPVDLDIAWQDAFESIRDRAILRTHTQLESVDL